MIPFKRLQNKKIKNLVFRSVLAICVCSLITSCAGSRPQVTLNKHPQAPNFTLTSLDGNKVSLSSFIGKVVKAPPYPGAKPSFLIEDQIEDREWLCDLVRLTEKELPIPKPKKSKKKNRGETK